MGTEDKVLLLLGTGAFGVIIGWYVYYVNRFRKGDVQLGDVTTLIGVIGGGAILQLFKEGTPIFGAYGIGLFIGFFGYLITLSIMVKMSTNFGIDFFLDGRRKKLAADEMIPPEIQQTVRPMTLAERVEVLEQNQAKDQAVRSERVFHGADFTAVAWRPTPAAARVISACVTAWNDVTKADCNKYAKEVLTQFGLSDFAPGDDANTIAAKLADSTWCTSNKWKRLANGVEAKAEADVGRLVIGAITGPNYVPPETHGHVVVVVSSELLHRDKYPFAYWGKLHSVGEMNAPVTHAYNAKSVDKVVYASKSV